MEQICSVFRVEVSVDKHTRQHISLVIGLPAVTIVAPSQQC